ncbi:hypothetical protein [Streptomyces sp. NPDC093970]
MRGILGFIGITDVEFIAVNGQTPEQVEAGLSAADKAIAESLKAL